MRLPTPQREAQSTSRKECTSEARPNIAATTLASNVASRYIIPTALCRLKSGIRLSASRRATSPMPMTKPIIERTMTSRWCSRFSLRPCPPCRSGWKQLRGTQSPWTLAGGSWHLNLCPDHRDQVAHTRGPVRHRGSWREMKPVFLQRVLNSSPLLLS